MTDQISFSQQRWRERFESCHSYYPSTNQPEVTMAQVIKLPARANAIDYDEDTVQDVLDSLLDAGEGEGVVIDEAQDSESKARVRCRTMSKLLANGRTVDTDEYGDEDEGREQVKTRTHVVPQGEGDSAVYLPVLSLKS